MQNLIRKVQIADAFIGLFSIAILASTFVYDKASLPLGWEIPKVNFWQIFSLIIILLFVVYSGYGLFVIKRKVVFPSKLVVFFITSVLIGSLVQNNEHIVLYTDKTTLLYSGLISLFGTDGVMSVKVSLFGNPYRYFGLITFGLIVLSSIILKQFVNKKNWHVIVLSLITSSLLQAFVAIYQFIELIGNRDFLRQGQWVYGGYGQTNFLVGHLLIGSILSYYYLKSKNKYLAGISILTILFTLVASFFTVSVWGIAILLIFNIYLISDLVIGFKALRKYLHIVFIASIFLVIPFINILGIVEADFLFRAYIWADIYDYYLKRIIVAPSFSALKETLFGSGLDNLISLLSRSQRIVNPFIDRAHNIVLDFLAAFGVVGTSTLIYIVHQGVNLKKEIQTDNKYFITVVAFLGLFIRSLVHTNSINNFVHLLILIAVLFALKNPAPVRSRVN